MDSLFLLIFSPYKLLCIALLLEDSGLLPKGLLGKSGYLGQEILAVWWAQAW
jgi:hypothetical protein